MQQSACCEGIGAYVIFLLHCAITPQYGTIIVQYGGIITLCVAIFVQYGAIIAQYVATVVLCGEIIAQYVATVVQYYAITALVQPGSNQEY